MCVGGGEMGRCACRQVRRNRKILTTGSGRQPVAAALSNLTSKRCARRPGIDAVHWSRLTHRLAHLSLLPFSFPPAADAGWPGATEVSLFNPPAPQVLRSVCRRCASPSKSPLISLPPCHPPPTVATHGGLRGVGTWTDGWTGRQR